MNNNKLTISPITQALAAFDLVGFVLVLLHLSPSVLVPILFAFFRLESDRFLSIERMGVIKDRPMLSQRPAVGQTAVTYFGIRARLKLITGAGVTLICLLLGVDYPRCGACGERLSLSPTIVFLPSISGHGCSARSALCYPCPSQSCYRSYFNITKAPFVGKNYER